MRQLTTNSRTYILTCVYVHGYDKDGERLCIEPRERGKRRFFLIVCDSSPSYCSLSLSIERERERKRERERDDVREGIFERTLCVCKIDRETVCEREK